MSNDQKRPHPFDHLMFGNRGYSQPSQKSLHEPNTNDQSNDDINQSSTQSLDLNGIIHNIDQIRSTVNQISPMIKQLSPLLSLFKKK